MHAAITTCMHVNLTTESLHNLMKNHPESSLKILRIYGRAVERQQYPGPYRYKHAYQREQSVLRQHYDIGLYTCNEASSKRLSGRMRKDGTVDKLMSPRQCIIDESGMAYEPETMIPISLCEHAALLGDHKQLQPIVEYHPAREHGLTTSLFQRYVQSVGFCKTLTVQYRMV